MLEEVGEPSAARAFVMFFFGNDWAPFIIETKEKCLVSAHFRGLTGPGLGSLRKDELSAIKMTLSLRLFTQSEIGTFH